jgi:hypothetical protein
MATNGLIEMNSKQSLQSLRRETHFNLACRRSATSPDSSDFAHSLLKEAGTGAEYAVLTIRAREPRALLIADK